MNDIIPTTTNNFHSAYNYSFGPIYVQQLILTTRWILIVFTTKISNIFTSQIIDV